MELGHVSTKVIKVKIDDDLILEELEKSGKEGIKKEGAKATMNVADDATEDVCDNVAMKTAAVAVRKETKNKVVKDAIVVTKLALEIQ